jgi:hypothetical protein
MGAGAQFGVLQAAYIYFFFLSFSLVVEIYSSFFLSFLIAE